MPQSLAQIYLHIAFSTKERQPFLGEKQIRTEMHAYLSGACKTHKCVPLAVGGVEDHVHLLVRMARTISVADLLRELKRQSSLWIKTKSVALALFDWQDGYGAFSLGPGQVETVTDYISNQEEHHRTESYQDEFRRLLAAHGVEYDERYVWD